MTLKISGILIPLLCFASESRNENIKDNLVTTVITPPSPPQDSTDHKKRSQKTFSKDLINQLQDIHNFNSIFDDSYFGGIFYEQFDK